MKKFLVMGILLAMSFAGLRAMRYERTSARTQKKRAQRRGYQSKYSGGQRGALAGDTGARQKSRRERGYMSAGLCARQQTDLAEEIFKPIASEYHTLVGDKERLTHAVRYNKVYSVRRMLEKGVSPHLYRHDKTGFGTWELGESLLEVGVRERYPEVVALLLEHGAGAYGALDKPSELEGNTLLYRAVANYGTVSSEQKEYGVLPEHVVKFDIKLITSLLEHKAQVDKMGADKLTPLQKALWRLLDIDIISLLINYGASVKAVNQDSALLSHVAHKAKGPVIRFLVLSGVNFNQLAPGRALSPLQEAPSENQQEMSGAQEFKDYCDVVTRLPKFLGYLPTVLQRIVAEYYIEEEIAAELKRRAGLKPRS
jgi:predicted outer membrane lipoprotein